MVIADRRASVRRDVAPVLTPEGAAQSALPALAPSSGLEVLQVQRRLLSRRRVLAGGLGLGAATLLAACGGDDDDATAQPGSTAAGVGGTPTATTAATATLAPTETSVAATPTVAAASGSPSNADGGVAYPVTVEHDLGTTIVPTQPARIIATYDTEPLDVLLAVGVQPVWVGITGTYDVPLAPWVSESDLVGVEAPQVEMFMGHDVEQFAAVNPDLILDVWSDDTTLTLLNELAPTLVLKAAETTPWQTVQRYAALATNTVEEAEAAIAETERVLDEQVARLAPYADRAVTVAYQWNGSINVHGGNIVIGSILTRMGLSVVAPDPDGVTVLPTERWNDLAEADILLSLVFVADEMAQQEADPLFRSLPAIAGGHYMVLDQEMARAMYMESTLSVRWVAPLLADAIIEAAEGGGRTVE